MVDVQFNFAHVLRSFAARLIKCNRLIGPPSYLLSVGYLNFTCIRDWGIWVNTFSSGNCAIQNQYLLLFRQIHILIPRYAGRSTSSNTIILFSRWKLSGLDSGLGTRASTFIVAFALKQVKTAYRSGITQAHRDIYHTWLCLANENTGSRLPRA